MRHTIPNGDPAAIFDRALTALLSELERTKLAAAARPRATRPTSTSSRHVPAAVKRAVWARDSGRCAFVGTNGRCRETGFLEFHHVTPYAAGGETSVENLQLRCRAHNAYEAEKYFGAGGPLFVRKRCSTRWATAELVPERAASGHSREAAASGESTTSRQGHSVTPDVWDRGAPY
jgi:5-methylcytosine-specific restriction endonuclease McrA